MTKKIMLCGAIAVVVLLLITGYWVSETQNGVKGADSPRQVDATQNETPVSEKPEARYAAGETDLDPVTDTREAQVASKQSSVTSPVPENYDSAEQMAAQWAIDAAQWNIDAGYPTETDADAYRGIDVDELVSLAERGDRVAAYQAGLRLAVNGREDEARDVLFDSVSDGSIAAASLLRDMYAGFYGVPSDRAESDAWSRVTQAMGNPAFPTDSLTADEATLANHLFSLYWQEINSRYMREHGTPMPVIPFPPPPPSPDPGG